MARYFTFKEMVKTDTGIENIPGWEEIENLKRLSNFIDVVRVEFGKAIRVNCAYRSPAVNQKVGGVSTSAHLKGLAADICAWSGKESDNRELLSILEKGIGSLDQLISYHSVAGDVRTKIRFIHVGLADNYNPRGQRLYK